MKALLAAGVVGVSRLVVPAAQAEQVTKLDRDHGVRFTLDGRVLTVRLVPQSGRPPPDVRGHVWGLGRKGGCETERPISRRRAVGVIDGGEEIRRGETGIGVTGFSSQSR
jgi:hypothetical protein